MQRAVLGFLLLVTAVSASAAGPPIHLTRASGSITVDGDLSDEAWKTAAKIDQWWETNPGDNVEPKAKSIGYLTYDDHFLYAAFEMTDPEPHKIRAPFNDHDHIGGNTDDYAGIILDTRNDGKTAILFLVNPRNIQYDAVSDDTTGNEDNSPDFFWDSATRLTPTGWVLEMRIPFSSLRYSNSNPDEWGIMLYRNWPRDRRYQMFGNKLPRGNNCFICNESKMSGLANLPPGGHVVAAPYVTARQIGETRDGLGTPIVNQNADADAGLDVKWTPTPNMALDATINPDFSQIESDVAQIQTNERFAIFFPEKRPFFLEGVELFSTPFQAVYTRTITAPRWGGRTTGKYGKNAYTFLVTKDEGGGLTIIPGPVGSGFASQNFSSTNAIGRVRHDWGKSFGSILFTDRENEGSAHNRVIGPDFQWKTEHHNLTGQYLYSDSKTPDRPDLASEWNGQTLKGHAADLWYNYSSEKWDFFSEGKDVSDHFRADLGFVPQVGYKSNYNEGGYTTRPKDHFLSRIRYFAMAEYDAMQDGSKLYRLLSFGFGSDGKYQWSNRLRYAYDTVRTTHHLFDRHQLLFSEQFSLGRKFSTIGFSGWVGQQIDFANERLGNGASINPYATIRPTNHLQLDLTGGVQWLTLPGQQPGQSGQRDRLYTSQVERVRASYTFNSKMFLRAIIQNERTNSDPLLYHPIVVDQHSGDVASSILFAYKLNWQTVMYVGYGDLREVMPEINEFRPSNRQFFFKTSYAFQR
jgi:hypothetical protein